MDPETIAAIATPPGTGAVCLLRVSGPSAVAVVEKLWRGRKPLRAHPPRVLARGTIMDASGHDAG